MSVYVDVSAAVHHRAGLGRYAESLVRALEPRLPDRLALFYNREHGITPGDMDWVNDESDGSNWTKFSTANGLIYHSINCITSDRSNHIWVGTNIGVSRYNGSSWTNAFDS